MPKTKKPENVRLTFHHDGMEHTLHIAETDEIVIDQEYGDVLTVTVKAVNVTVESERLPLPVEYGTVIEGDCSGHGRRDRFILLPANALMGGSGWRSFRTGEIVRESHIANWKIITKGNENG